jgi:hypothetical protein
MNPLQPPDSHHVSAAAGWLGLGRHKEALEELREVAPESALHPDVLEVLWHIQAKTGQWAICLEIAQAIIKLDMTRTFGWIHASRSLHELKRTQEAFDQLHPLAQHFPDHWTIPYDLACYCAHLRRFSECQLWLRRAAAIDKPNVDRKAVADPNLKPLWSSMIAKNVTRGLNLDPGPCNRVAGVDQFESHATQSKR